jgi:flagellar basal-body rod protein FlgC
MSDIYEIAASGMAAQRVQMDLIGENLANAGVIRADGSVFRPKVAVLESGAPFESVLQDAVLRSASDDPMAPSHDAPWPTASMSDGESVAVASFGRDAVGLAGVTVAGVVEQQRPPQYRLDPGNPFAQRGGPHKGYVALPDVDPIQEMVQLVASGRAYDADVSMLQAAKQMDVEAADIERV